MKDSNVKTWHKIVDIPKYLIQGITDRGMEESVDNNGIVDKDDLRVTIKLSAGVMILLDNDTRLIANEEGITIEGLS